METIIVTRHKAVELYIRSHNMVAEGTKCYSSVTHDFVKDKHVYGIIPFSLAASAAKFTEVKVTLKRGVKVDSLTLDEIEACVKEVRTYEVQETSRQV